jgi:uncharacterized protein (DUF433 family)
VAKSKTLTYEKLVWQDPERVSGQPCFYGTRVPIRNLSDSLEGNYTVEQFCEIFSIPRKQAMDVLELGLAGTIDRLQAA